MSVKELHRLREEYRRTSDSYGHELRLSFAEIVVDKLRELGWTQKALSQKLRVSEPQISRLLNGDHNWTSESAGRILFALGVRAHVKPASEIYEASSSYVLGSATFIWTSQQSGGTQPVTSTKDYLSGQKTENRVEQESTPSPQIAFAGATG